MKKIITLIALLTATFSTTSFAAQKPLRLVADFTYPPFNYKDEKGQPAGFDIEIGNALCQEMNRECEWVSQSWDGLIPALLSRKADAILASMRATEERKRKILFTNKYYQTTASFMIHQDENIEISKEGFKGKTIGVQIGTIHDRYVTDTYGDVANIKRYTGQDEVFLDFDKGTVDIVFGNTDQLQLAYLDKANGKNGKLAGDPVTDVPYLSQGMAIGLRMQDKQLAQDFNQAIDAIRADGTYDKIADKYFTFDIYGN